MTEGKKEEVETHYTCTPLYKTPGSKPEYIKRGGR
jgi:hypothetical protein